MNALSKLSISLRTSVAIAATVLTAATSITAKAQTLNFDDVTTNTSGFNSAAFSAYQGYVFENWGVMTTAAPGTGTNAVSGTKFAYAQADGSSFIYRNSPIGFNFFDAFVSFRQLDLVNPDNSPQQVVVNGYRAGQFAPAYTSLITLTVSAQLFTFNFLNVEEVEFVTDNLQANGRTTVLAMDNAQLAVVPEPSTWVLMVVGLAGVALLVKRRNIA